MAILNYALAGNFKKFRSDIKKISQRENISSTRILFKFFNCFRLIRCGYSDFLNYELYNKTIKEILEYVSIGDQDKFYKVISPAEYKTFFTIKPNFLKNFKKYIDRDFYTYDMGLEKLKTFIKNNPYFMIKPYDGLGGKGVEKVYSKDIKNIDEYYEYLKNNRLFLEEYIKQNKEVSKICSQSVNTIRIMTFLCNGKSKIIFAAMRFGNGINSVDNFHKGGMGVLVDYEKGILVGDAYDKDLNKFTNHPESNIKFDGFKIPNFDIVKKIVLEAAKVNKNIRVVGWDVAITDKGATFVEGNRRPGFDLIQVLYKKGCKYIMRDVLKEFNKENNTKYKI